MLFRVIKNSLIISSVIDLRILLSKTFKFATWSTLSQLGNSPLARLTLFAPVVVALIKLKDEFFQQYIDPNFEYPNLEAMYWALMMLSAAQLVYTVFAPRSIKKFGSDREKYQLEKMSTITQNTVDIYANKFLISLYKSHYNNIHFPFPLDKFVEETTLIEQYKALDLNLTNEGKRVISILPDVLNKLRTGLKGWSLPNQTIDAADLDVLKVSAKIHPSFICKPIDASSLSNYQSTHYLLSRSLLFDFVQHGEHSFTNSNWMKELIDWRYSSLNVSNKLAILLAFALYIFGLSFFVTKALNTFLTMNGTFHVFIRETFLSIFAYFS